MFKGCDAATACATYGLTAASGGNKESWERSSSWLLPRSFWENRVFAKESLIAAISLNNGKYCTRGADHPAGMPAGCAYDFGGLYTGYILGGAINDVEGNATGINPMYRQSGTNIISLEEPIIDGGMRILRDRVSNSTPCFNHDGYPDKLGDGTTAAWQKGYWGTQVSRLTEIKMKYDPNNRFNCYQCIGYTRVDETDTAPQDTVANYDPRPFRWQPNCPTPTGWILVYSGIAVGALLIVVIVVGAVFYFKKGGSTDKDSGAAVTP